VQAKLARLLRDREAWVGPARELVDVDVRAIAGVGGDLDGAVDDGRLRSDLYERFASAKVEVPPLRERRDDIPVLALHFLRDACQRRSREPKMFSRSSLVLMAALPWQGNVAELRGLVDALVGSVHRSVIQLDDVLEHASLDGMSARLQVGLTLRDAKAKFERECISAVLRQHHGRVGEAAKALGIQRTNLYRKVRQLNVARSLLSARR
jgi:DNA-binding NtrC family response regulator